MKKLLIIVLIPLCVMSMETPTSASNLLTLAPLNGDDAQLTSFAESVVLGQLRIGMESNKGVTSLCFNFNDFRNPKISYTVTQEQAWDITRYIVANSLKELIKATNKHLQAYPGNVAHIINGVFVEKIEAYKKQLKELNVSESLPILIPTQESVEKKFEDLIITNKDTGAQKTFKTALTIKVLKEFKQDPAFLRYLSFTRFYQFWNQVDLIPQTKKDRHERNFDLTKEQRKTFFTALQNNDIETLSKFRHNMNSIIAKEKPTTMGSLDKMISGCEQNKHLDPSSPQNSDDEIW